MRTHWFVRYYPYFSKVAQLVIWASGGYSGIWAAWKGRPVETVVLFLVLGAAGAAVFSYYALRIGDYLEGLTADAQLGRDFADELQDRHDVREVTMTTARAAEVLGAVDPRTDRHNTRFRWIKNAIDNKQVAGSPLNENGDANVKTVLKTIDLAAFFRRKDWRHYVRLPGQGSL